MMSDTAIPQIDDLVIATPRKEIVFIEDNVPDLSTLLAGIGAGKEVVILDSSKDGLQQIADALAGRSSIDGLHIVSHGTAGSVNLGGLLLDAHNLGAHGAELQAIRQAMAAGGDILLYGCDIGAGSAGQAFVEQLAIATGADVAASSNLTGSTALGGDWDLEISSGQIETRAVVDASLAALYQKTLSITSVNVDFDSQFANYGGMSGPQDDVVVRVNGDASYLLKIDGATKNVASYGGGYIASDGQDGSGETMLTFNFVNGQVFSPMSIDVTNFQPGGAQHLIFTAYDAANNKLGTKTGDTSAIVAEYTHISLAGLTNVARLTLTGDPATNGGKLFYLVFDNFQLTNIQPADTTPPAAPGRPVLDSGSDSGTLGDGITNVNQPTFGGGAGSTEAAATIRVYDGATLIATTTANANGSWSVASNVALAEGAHSISATATDSAGNKSASSPGLTVVVDRTAPVTMAASAVFSNDTGASSTDMVTSAANGQTVSGLLNANLAAGEHVEVSLDNGVSWATATASAGSNTWSVAATLSASNTLQVRVVDTAGNAGTAYTRAYVLDTSAPSAPSTPDLDTASDSGTSHTDDITGNKMPTFSGTAEAGATVTLYDGATAIGSTTAAGGTWHITSNIELGQGSHSITAKATDLAGNTGAASSALSVFIETRTPTTGVASLAFSADTGSSATDLVTNTAAQTISGTLDANLASGERVELSFDNGASWTGATAAVGSNTWSLPATLAAGTHTLQVRVANSVDNSGPVHSQDYTLDQAAPSVTIASDAAQLKAGETATITFTFSEDPGATFTWNGSVGDVVVSGGTLSAISGTGLERTATFTPNANTNAGSASIGVPAGAYRDLAGNNGAASNDLTLGYDTLAPSKPSAPSLALNDDTGAPGDYVTKADPITLSGTAEAGATVKLYDGGSVIASTTASGGTYSFTLTGLAEGNHSFAAVAVDAAGNTGAASDGLAVTIDRTVPATTVASASLSADTGASSTDMVTKEASQTISGTLSANLASGEQVMVSLDNGATWNPATASVGSTAWELAATLAGSGTLKVKVVDLAGNDGAVYAHAYVLDQSAPAASSMPDLDAASDSGADSTDDITGVTLPSFSGTAEVGAKVTLFDGGIEIGSTVATDGTWHITTSSSTPLDQRIHYITAEVVDIAGNHSATSPVLELDVRTAGPSTTVATMALASDSGVNGDFITNAASQTLSGTLSANLAVGERVQVSLDNGATWSNATSAVGQNTWSTALTLAAGSHDIQVRVIDPLDNFGAVHTQAYTLDTMAPTLSIASSAPTLKAGETATITFTFSEDPGTSFDVSDIVVSGGTLSGLDTTGTTRTATFTPSANANAGSASISVASGAYHDVAGNNGAASNNLTLGYDTLAPAKPSAPSLAVNDDTGVPGDYVTKANPITLSGTAEAGATVKLYDGGIEIASTTAAGGNYSFTLTNLAEDNHSFAVVAVDAAGNESAASDGLGVTIDRTPPSTTIAGATLSQDTGASSTDMVTKEASQTIFGTLSANLASGEQVMVSLDNGATWNPATASVGSTAWELAATLSGSSTLKVKVVDLAGNDGAVYAHAYVLDQSAPAASSMPDLDAASDSGADSTDDITGVTLPSFSGTAEVGAKVTLFDGGIEIGSVVATDGTWHITTSSSTPLDQRIHYITAEVVDIAGNHSATSPVLELDVRTAGPSTTVATMALASDSGVNGDFITNAASQTLSGTLSANLAVGERVQVSLDNGATWSNATSAVGQNTWSKALTLAVGSHDIQVRVIDPLDNFGAVHTQAYTLDAVKPSVAITSNVAQLKAGETATITFTFSEDPGSSFDASDLAIIGGTLSPLQGTGAIRTASFTPTADTDGGTASIGVNANSYEDLAGNLGTAGTPPSLAYDTHAPAAPSVPDLHKDSDSGAFDTDNLTSNTALVFTGSAEAGATVRLYDSDGTTEIGHATALGGNWSITTSTLLDGSHTVTAKAFDAAGNVSTASGPLTVTIDSAKPAAMAAPDFKTGSDSGTSGDGITNVKKPVFSGSAEAFAQVTLYDGAAVLGTVNADAAGVWEFTPAAELLDGTHAISARQTDRAGNQSDAGTAFNVTVDTVAPAAPAAPKLAPTSDTDTLGDGITENNMPVIEGTALANTLVTLYDISGSGKAMVGSVMADGSGKWSIATTGLPVDSHSLSVTQTDAAGNESLHSMPFLLRIDAPPVPVKLIDGVAVDIQPISLPGGVIGSAVSIPVVSAGRVDSTGQAGVADIPLLTSSQGGNLLTAAVPLGVGLSANGASVPAASGAELLIAAIKAATPTHGATDQGHLTGNGQSFLNGLAASGTLLVETVKPVSAAGAPDGVLTLSGPVQPQGQSTALVIDTGGLGVGTTIKLQDVNFAAVIGAASVVSTGSMVLSGDAASQHFTVAAGMGANAVLAGGGNDTLALSPPAAAGTGAGAVMLHGGSESDVAVFSGARADYDLAFHNAYVTVASKSGPATVATVVNVEALQFSDGQVAVQNGADMRTLAGLYQTVLGRQADISGIEFWASGHQAGANWGDIALHMIASSERLASHEGFNGNATHDITMLYTALFNRAPDAEGLAFWVNAMTHGVSLEHIADEFVKSVEMVGHQRAVLDWDFING